MTHWTDRIAVFDTETTGTDTEEARIVTACIAVLDAAGEVAGHWTWLIDPGVEIPDEASAVHGVTTEHAREHGADPKESIGDIANKLAELSLPVVAFNAPFDFSILRAECERHELPFTVPDLVVDPFVLDKQIDRYRKGKRQLANVAEHYGVPLLDAHDATADAVAAGRIAQIILQRPSISELITPDNAVQLQRVWKERQNSSFESYLRRTSDPAAVIQRGWPLLERV